MSVLTIDEQMHKQKNEAFLKLVKKNPTLPIVPMVDNEIVGEDYGYVDSLFKLIMPKYDKKGEYISTEQRLRKLKNIQAERRINHCVEKLRNVAIRKHY